MPVQQFPPPPAPMQDMKQHFTHFDWQAWFRLLPSHAYPLGVSGTGTTANRPLGVSPGQFYFDQTLGIPIWVKSLSPTVWVNASGGVV
jgi:hypothetical protein